MTSESERGIDDDRSRCFERGCDQRDDPVDEDGEVSWSSHLEGLLTDQLGDDCEDEGD